MLSLRPRPRFEVCAPGTVKGATEALRTRLRDEGASCAGMVARGHFLITVPEERRHLWSPVLDATVGQRGNEVVIEGRFGPAAGVWTFFVFVAAVLASVGTAAAVYAYAESIVHGDTALWPVAGIAVALLVVEYVGVMVGQTLGNDQIDGIERFVREAICEPNEDIAQQAADIKSAQSVGGAVSR